MAHQKFWQKHPALLYAATFLIASFSFLFCDLPWLFPVLWGAYLVLLKKFPLILLIPAMALYCHLRFQEAPEMGEGIGIFSIQTVAPHQSPFHKGWVYKGTLFFEKTSFPCRIYTQGKTPPYPADFDYCLFGKYLRTDRFELAFKPKQWVQLPSGTPIASWRASLKKQYTEFLKGQCAQFPKAALFLAGLTTGDVEDRLLKYEFGRLGLQHILAISGFHFGVLIVFFSFVLSLFLPRRGQWILLLIAINAYYFFVGPFPGVQRAWLTAMFYLLAKLLQRGTSGLNLLGCAMGFEILYNPLIVSNMGFQLSFASCFGLLLLYPLVENGLRRFMPLRKKEEWKHFSLLEKSVYLISGFLRGALAITVAVNSAILPILLFHFHTFPLLSLLYNLFYPFCVGLLLSSLLFSLSVYLLCPPLGGFLCKPRRMERIFY